MTTQGEEGGASLAGAIQNRARVAPLSVAIDDGGHAITYSELHSTCSRIADALIARVPVDSRIGLLFDRPADYVVAMLAALMAGRCFVPLDARYDIHCPLPDLKIWLGRRTSPLYATQAGVWHDIEALDDPSSSPVSVGQGGIFEQADSAYVLFTSGSTGKAKAVDIQPGQLNAYLPAIVDRLALTSRDRWCQFASPSFDVFIEETLPILFSGGTLICPPGLSTPTFDTLHQRLVRSGATLLELPTRYFCDYAYWLQERRRSPPQTLRCLLVGGEHMPVQPYRAWQKAFPLVRLAHVYGVTEATVTSTIFEGTLAENADEVPVGTPLACARIQIVDADPDTGLGEVLIEGPGVGAGYLNDTLATQLKFLSSPDGTRRYRTGDLGRIMEGQLVLAGRLDDEVKVDGHRVNLSGIEQAISAVAGTTCVVLRTDTGRIAAILKAGEGALASPLRAIDAGRRRNIEAELTLPAWARPAEWYEMEALPSNGHGKADRSALRTTLAACMPSNPSPSAAGADVQQGGQVLSALERRVLAAFRDALESPAFGFEDDFFEWGGDSLAAVRLSSALAEVMPGRESSPELLVDAPTPALMSRLCQPCCTPIDMREGQVLQLSHEEAQALAGLSASLAERFQTSDDPDVLPAIRAAVGQVPPRLREELRKFVEGDEAPYLIIRGHLINSERIGRTPAQLRTRGAPCRALAEELLIAAYGELMGHAFSWATQQDGRLVHDVFPVRKDEFAQLGTGSRELLTWHTEDAFHAGRADFVLLLALRNPDEVATTVGTLQGWQPDAPVYDTLFSERFIILPDESHLPKNNSPDVVQTTAGGFDEILQMRQQPTRIAVLSGDKARPKLRLDPYFMTPVEGDHDAERALTAVVHAIDERLQNVALRAGDLLVLNNARAVHGRVPFQARFDGTDRWLKRLNVRL
jgi:L-asparagine oxygenase